MPRTTLHISLILSILLCVSCDKERHFELTGDVSVASLWSLCTERSRPIKEDVYISGYVVANDIYKELCNSIVIADSSGGIELKIECENINDIVPLFSHVRLRCSGLSIGREGNKVVIGATPTTNYVVDRITQQQLLNYLTIIDDSPTIPNGKDIHISDIDVNKVLCYVAIHNLKVVSDEATKTWCERDTTSYFDERYLTTIRHFVDGCDTLRVVTFKECVYASEQMPTQRCSLQGIIDWHDGDYALRISSHQIDK